VGKSDFEGVGCLFIGVRGLAGAEEGYDHNHQWNRGSAPIWLRIGLISIFLLSSKKNALVLDSDDTLWGLSWSLGRPRHDTGVRQLGLAGSAEWRKCGHNTSE
jgi:hypothetical protein